MQSADVATGEYGEQTAFTLKAFWKSKMLSCVNIITFNEQIDFSMRSFYGEKYIYFVQCFGISQKME